VIRSITVVNITNIDLNLLLVLHAVLEEGSATRAAKRLHVTQSAVSNALGRLRAVLGDALLVRGARGLTPTPRALELRPRLALLVREASLVLERPPAFDPKSSTREFSLACADYYGAVIVPALVRLLSERAPHATLRMRTLDDLVGEHGLDQDVDVHVGMPPSVPNGCVWKVLFEDRFVCLSRRGQLGASRRFSLKAYLAAPHVRVSLLGRVSDPVDRLLEGRGKRRRVALIVPYFAVIPFVVHETGLLATLSRRMALPYAERLPIDLSEPPFALPAYGVRMLWHRRTDADPAARFFRDLVEEVFRELPAKSQSAST
jgi:DNA-binding transcriptional LysR family regulator